MADLLGLSRDEAAAAVDELLTLGLVRVENGALVARSPEVAAGSDLAALELDAAERQQRIAEFRANLATLQQSFDNGRRAVGSSGLELLTDLQDVLSVIRICSAQCEREVLCAQPDGPRAAHTLDEAVGRDEAMLRRGVDMRTIYQHSARHNQPTAEYVNRITHLGAEVRIARSELTRMIVFDRSVGVLGVSANRNSALIVRDPHVLEFMADVFERAWQASTPFAEPQEVRRVRTASEEIQHTIMTLLGQGLDGRSVARRLGISERTCQRHLADAMGTLGARTRFQAGYLYRAGRAIAEGGES